MGKQQQLYRILHHHLAAVAASSSSNSCRSIARSLTTSSRKSQLLIQSPDQSHRRRSVLASPWSATQLRGAKFRGSDVKPGNVIERKDFTRFSKRIIRSKEEGVPAYRLYGISSGKVQNNYRLHRYITVELRDVDSGNKTNERFRTDEPVEKVFVEEKHYTYLYTEDDVVVLMEPDTYNQIDVPKDLFGDAAVFLKDDMRVFVQLYDGRPMSASVPQRVLCKVSEAKVIAKGSTATPQYKKVLLDNGLTVQVPAHVLAGDEILVNTSDNSYITRVQ